MNWTTDVTPPQPKKPLSPLTISALGAYGTEDAITTAWKEAAQALAVAKDLEARLRLVLFEIKFANPQEGVNRTELGNGYSLKADYPFNYTLNDKEGQTEKALDAITAISQQAGFIADRLIRWKPELSTKEYRLLNPDVPSAQTAEQKAILAVLAPVLTIKPGMPQLEIEPPKVQR